MKIHRYLNYRYFDTFLKLSLSTTLINRKDFLDESGKVMSFLLKRVNIILEWSKALLAY